MPRLKLRGLLPAEESFLAELDTSREVIQLIHSGPLSPDEARSWADVQVQPTAFKFGKWMITLQDADCTRIGWIELANHAKPIDETDNDHFAWVTRCYQRIGGNGYMQEAASAVIDYAFHFGLDRVLVYARPAKVRSVELIHRLGFRQIGNCMDDARDDCDLYQLRREEWPGDEVIGGSTTS